MPTENKLRLVLSVVSGEMTIARAARHGKVSEESLGRWRQQFLSGGKAHLQLRVWRKSAEYRLALRGPRDDPHRRGDANLEARFAVWRPGAHVRRWQAKAREGRAPADGPLTQRRLRGPGSRR